MNWRDPEITKQINYNKYRLKNAFKDMEFNVETKDYFTALIVKWEGNVYLLSAEETLTALKDKIKKIRGEIWN